MNKVIIFTWLLLTLVSSGGGIAYFLQQQYEDQSAEFRILYREMTVRLTQHDAIIPLLPASNGTLEVQKLFPQIIFWRSHSNLEPRRTVVPEQNGRYWLNATNLSLFIDLNILFDDLVEKAKFKHLTLDWHNSVLFEQGTSSPSYYWQWEKNIASQSQPFALRVGADPDWARFPWLLLLVPALFWAVVFYLFNQYRFNQRQRNIADLRAHYAELTRLNAMGELAAGIMHELNQPLTAILSYNQAAQRLIKQNNSEPVPALLDAAVVQIKRTDALLQGFRHKLANEQTDYQPIDLSVLWSRVIMLLDNEIRRHKIRVSSHIPLSLPVLFAPPLWVEQILHNILSNAIQAQQIHTRGSGWVILNAYSEEGGITLTIADGGSGLSEHALKHVFMPFFTTRKQGVGLGMALTETLVQRLNGKIDVVNVAGQGACFTLWLPSVTQEA